MKIDIYEQMPDHHILSKLQSLHKNIFGSTFSEERLKQKNKMLALIAMKDDQVVGYKIGYEESEKYFYSWIGGVDPEYRNNGIASKLMYLQHQWCEKQQYNAVQTKTKNKWRNMLILNLKHGFDIIGTYTDSNGDPKIILQKKLG